MSEFDIVRYCFIPDEKEVFAIAEIKQRNAEKREATVSLLKGNKTLTMKYENMVAIGSMEELDNPPSDLIKLVYVHRPGILHTLKSRFMRDRIYTSIGPILVALNPFKWIPGVYEEDIMVKYKSRETNLSDNPHVFAVSQDAYSDLYKGSNQSLIISGESGAGKTEATKQCLNYLAFLAGSATGIQSKILKASPILEAWGNAKTLRNNNSSRFGKFIEIWFDGSYTITGSSNTTYILEKSRVVFQEKDERNYHVFYQLLKGASPELLQELELDDIAANPESAKYINQSGCIAIENVDDGADFREVNDAFTEIGFTAEEQKSLYTIIAGILLFGNIVYEANPNNSDESIIPPEHLHWLEKGARRFGIEPEFVKKALLYKTIRSGGGGNRRTSVAFASYKPDAAYENKNALVKEIYKRCFDFIVAKINALMENDKDQAVNMIGILDIFGFEIFQKNSFEQLCINLANEALQQHFNYNIFQAEMDVYIAEDVPVPPLEYKDNQDVLDLIMKRPLGLIPMLDEEGLVPKGSWEGFMSKFGKQQAKHPRFKKAKQSSTDLGIVHYAGDVCYDPSLFLVKNKDTLSADLVDAFSVADLPLLQQLFSEDKSAEDADIAKRVTQATAKMTVGKSFSLQLEKLIADLNATQPRYIRCIKPNQVKKPNIFVPDLTNEQLTYSGVFEAVIIMQNGYPFRSSHQDFRTNYHMLVKDARNHRLLFDQTMHEAYAVNSAHPSATPHDSDTVGTDAAVLAQKDVRPFSREQCQLMVQFIAQEYPDRELQNCFVGKTRTFYRAPQHTALTLIRTAIVDRVVLRVQTRARTFIASKLARAIGRAENEWFTSLSSRNVEKINLAAEKGDALVVRLNCAVKGLNFSLECSKIGALYGHAFDSENRLGPAIKSAIDEPVDILDKYDRLEVMLKGLDTVNFTVQYRTSLLSFRWEDKAELKDHANRINAMGELVRVKRKFLSGISGKNEVALEEAMVELSALKQAGKTEEGFCVAEASSAQKIIAEAELLFEQFITNVTLAINTGRFVSQHRGNNFQLAITVDPAALDAIIATYQKEMQNKSADAVPPVRIRALHLLCEQLRDLRQLAKQGTWETVWSELQAYWGLSDGAPSKAAKTSGYQQSQKFLPAELKSSLQDEIKDVSLAAINFFVVPQVQTAIARNTVPATPALGCDVTNAVDTTELSTRIAEAVAYEQYFDEDLVDFIKLAREHMYFREEVSTGDWARITALSSRATVIPRDHPDRVYVRNFVELYDAVTQIKKRIIEDRVTGEAGAFDFAAIQVTGLRAVCEQAKAMTVRGTAWANLLEVADTIRSTREKLQQAQFAEAWTYMQNLATSESWQRIVASVTNSTVDDSVADAVQLTINELKSYECEILHARSMQDIITALAVGGIGDVNSDFSIGAVNSGALQSELDAKAPHLIMTASATQLVADCKLVIKARALAFTAQWKELEALVVPLREKTQLFDSCHPACQAEFKRCYDKVFDLQVRQKLQAGMQQGVIALFSVDGEVSCDLAAIVTDELQQAIAFARQGYLLCPTTQNVLSLACGLFCLRSTVAQHKWEPANRFFFGSTPTADLPTLLGSLDSNPALAKARRSLGTTIEKLDNLDAELPLDVVTRLVGATDLTTLSTIEVLAFLRKNYGADASITEELSLVNRLSNDRRCKLMLLLSACTGMIQGNLDEFDCSAVITQHIELALAYVKGRQALALSASVVNWSYAAAFLLSVRQTIIKATADQPGTEPILSEVFQPQDLQDILRKISAGYPTKELQLMLNKLKDQASFQELLQALQFGQAVFENGKVDVSRVQHAHLQERLDAAKRNPARSDRLDRLFFYIELMISIRTAISLGQWELSDREKANTEGASAMITVKRYLKEFEQARRFFSSPVEGVPPQILVDELRLIGREWERRLVKQRFATAFKIGAVTGHPLSLSLNNLRTDLLEVEIARMKEVQAVAVEKDSDFELYMQAGEELITMRQECMKIQLSYKHPTKFSFPSNSLYTILDAQDFIPDAIAQAVANVARVSKPPFQFAEEWQHIATFVGNMKACPAIPAVAEEVGLLKAETQDRAYIMGVLGCISMAYSGGSGAKSPRTSQDLISTLTAAQGAYDQHQAVGGTQLVTSSKKKQTVAVRHSKIREVIHNSAVVLLHYLRASSGNLFDSFSRDWADDKNFSKTPRLYTLAQNLGASYTMQQVLRSAAKVPLHSKVRSMLAAATMRLEDSVTKQEILLSFSGAQYVFGGSVGHVKPAPLAVPYMKHVLERMEKVGISDPAVEKLRAFFCVHLQLRQSIQQTDYASAFDALDDFLGHGKRSLEFVLEVLANKNYQVAPEALKEFLLLAQDICDRTWQLQAEEAVVSGRIQGTRGALHATAIHWQRIDALLRVVELMPAVSDHSENRKKLCLRVKNLRFKLLGSGDLDADSSHAAGESTVGFHSLQFAQKKADFGPIATKVLPKFIEQIVHAACTKVDAISSINISWNHLDELSSFAHYVGPIVDALNERVNGEFVLFGMFREYLLQECDLVHKHCESLQAGLALEAALQQEFSMNYSNDGLAIQHNPDGKLTRMLAGATAQRWNMFGQPQEYWWGCLTALGKSFQSFIYHVGAGSQDVLVLRPGTAAFKAILAEIYGLIAQVNNIDKQLKQSGYRKRASLPTNILISCDKMRLAIAEHTTLTRLERIIRADEVISYVVEDTGKVKIEVSHVRPIVHIDRDEDVHQSVQYEEFGREVKAVIAGARVDTTLGRLLVDMLLELMDIRIAAAGKRWLLLKQRCANFHWISEFATSPDIDVCQRFLRYKEFHRAAENAIFCCAMPTIVGWSLHSSSRETAALINDKVWTNLQQNAMVKYGSLSVQYVSLSQLLAVGEKVVSIVELLRKSQWVGSCKYSEQIVASDGGYFTVDDKAAPASLRAVVEASNTLEPYMRQFLLQTAANLENEMLIVELEHASQRVFRASKISGKPGELVIPAGSIDTLKDVSQRIAAATLTKRCHGLRAAEQAAKVLIKVIEAHGKGDLAAIVKYVDLLTYLSEIDCRAGALLASAPAISAVDDDELLKTDDSVFGHLISVKANPATLPSVGLGPTSVQDSDSKVVEYWNDSNVADKGDLQKAFVFATGNAFSEAVELRLEVREFLSLLHRHVVQESMYTEFVDVVKVAVVQTEPGAVNTSVIGTEELASFIDKYRKYAASIQGAPAAHLGNLMFDMALSLESVRRGQVTSDEELIAVGLELAGAACVKENEYAVLADATLFGGTSKNCFDLIMEEVEFADVDLKQRRLMSDLRSALHTPGLPTTHYPFNISAVRVEHLDAAYEACNVTHPACAEARRLHQAASILLVLRKYALRRDWPAMIAFYQSLEIAELHQIFADAQTLEEFNAYPEVMLVSHAVDLAIESYIAGYIGGTVGAIAPCGDYFFDAKGPSAALTAFDKLKGEWLTGKVKAHANTCESLQAIRLHSASRNWEAVLAAATLATDGIRSGIRPVIPMCIEEIELAREHSAYVISLQELQMAVQNGALRGTVGDVQVWQMELDTIQKAYKTVTTINCRREDVLRLKSNVEFLFRLRKAILMDLWISPDITHDYLNLLGSNFQLQEERVQQKYLSAVLVDESLKPVAAVPVVSEPDSQEPADDRADEPAEDCVLPVEHASEEEPTVLAMESEEREEVPSAVARSGLPRPALTRAVIIPVGVLSSMVSKVTTGATEEPAADLPTPVIETVEAILANWVELKASKIFVEAAETEIELIHQEMRHRTMVSLLLKNIHTPGIQGVPGLVDTSNTATRLLEKAIFTATENSDVSLRGDCKGLLRDAKLLLLARRYRINEQWVELHHVLEEIELTLTSDTVEDVGDDTASSAEESNTKDYVRPIVKPVWQELQLLKFDTLFKLHLTHFTQEMTRPVPPPPPPMSPNVKVAAVSKHPEVARIEAVRLILEQTESDAQEYSSPEFARLIEAQAAALELRTFVHEYPNKSPQEIINLVAQTKKRDEEAGLHCYMAILIHDISNMANVLDFPVNLKTIHREIVKGQKYFSCPIGHLEWWLIDMELMSAAYNSAIPSLELFGTEHDHSFMKLAVVVIKLRGALIRGGLEAAIQVIDDNEEILQDPLMEDEVDRLRIEKENQDAGKLMEIGLKTGRYIDVLAIARMVHNYECRVAAKAAAETARHGSKNEYVGPEAKRASRRQAQSVSKDVTPIPETPMKPDEMTAPHRSSRATVKGAPVGGKRRSVQVEDGTVSEEFIDGVFRSINALNRAIAIAAQVRVRSANTEYYLNAVHVILRLRENTVADNWEEVKAYLESEETWNDLPVTALEEIRACKEGLLYQEHMARISKAFYSGAIYGLPHEIDLDIVSYDELVESLEYCAKVSFTDPSAVILMEFAERLIGVRHLLLEDQFQEFESLEEPREVYATERASRLRKSIYSHPLAKQDTHEFATVDGCVLDFLDYLSQAIPTLQTLFKVDSSVVSYDGRVDISDFINESRQVLMYKDLYCGSTVNNPDAWLTEVWHSVLHVVLEINLAQQVIKYRSVLLNLAAAVDSTPELVKAYLGDKHHVHMNMHPLLRSTHHYEDITLYGAGDLNLAAPQSLHKMFNVRDLENAIERAQSYVSSVGFETSEEMLKLQHSSSLLLDFRNTFNEQESHDRLLQLLRRAQDEARKGFLSADNGLFELNAYIACTAESVRIQTGLRTAIRSHYAYGPLNALQVSEIHCAELQQWIDDALAFLAKGGSALSIGIPTLLLQARVVHKLRTALLDKEWSALEFTLRSYESFASDWDMGRLEFRHIHCAYRFHCVKAEMKKFVKQFKGSDDLDHCLMCMDIDLRELQKIFAEFHSLLLYSSPLLGLSNLEHFATAGAGTAHDVFTSALYEYGDFVACFGMWRLFHALNAQMWFSKQQIHHNEAQHVSPSVDPFMYAYFGISGADYVHNVKETIRAGDIVQRFASRQGSDETVFAVLVATNWAAFPYNIRTLFNRVRNRLIDRYIRVDLKYYCIKGAVQMDDAGNLMISSVNLQFLKFLLMDAERAQNLASSLCVHFKWTTETEKWLVSAQTVLRYRDALIHGHDNDEIVHLLRTDGLLRGHTQFNPQQFNVHLELEVVEKYAQAFMTEKVAYNALEYLTTLAHHRDVNFNEEALENVAILQAFELAAAPVPVVDPSAYLLDMLNIVCLIRDAVFSAMLGGLNRLTPILEELCQAVSYQPQSTLQCEDVETAMTVLTTACKKAYHAELLDAGQGSAHRLRAAAAPAVTRRGAAVTSTRNYLQTEEPQPVQVPAPRSPARGNVARPELTGIPKLQAFTQKIVTALCELMYFQEEETHYSIGGTERFTEKLRSMVPTAIKSEAPYHCYKTLLSLRDSIDQNYAVFEPRWAVALHIVIYYLGEEAAASQSGSTNVAAAQMIALGQGLIQFCKDIQLDKCVLVDHLQSSVKATHTKIKNSPHLSATAQDTSPTVLHLVKHLTAIKMRGNENTVPLQQLKDGLTGTIEVTSAAAALMSTYTEAEEIGLQDDNVDQQVLRELPIGAAARAASQSKLMLKAIM